MSTLTIHFQMSLVSQEIKTEPKHFTMLFYRIDDIKFANADFIPKWPKAVRVQKMSILHLVV